MRRLPLLMLILMLYLSGCAPNPPGIAEEPANPFPSPGPVQEKVVTLVEVPPTEAVPSEARQAVLAEQTPSAQETPQAGGEATLPPGARVLGETYSARMNQDTDLTGDGKPELIVAWSGGQAGPAYQIFQSEGKEPEGYRLIGELVGDAQIADLEGGALATVGAAPNKVKFKIGSAKEILLPDASSASSWRVFRWNGERYDWGETLTMPQSPAEAQPVDGSTLPVLSTDLYFFLGGSWAKWAKGSSEIMPFRGDPQVPPAACSSLNGFCPSTDGKYDLTNLATGIEGIVIGVQDLATAQSTIIPGSYIHFSGYHTYRWIDISRALLFARAMEGGGLYHFDPISGERVTLIEASGCDLNWENCPTSRALLGFTDPFLFADGSTGFTVQSADPSLFPPPGVYRRGADGVLARLAELPLMDANCQQEGVVPYGRTHWTPDGSQFLYIGPQNGCALPLALLGKTDGSALWNMSAVLGAGADFRWGE